MANYWVKIRVDGNNINTVKKMIEKAFPNEVWQVEKINLSPSRADRLSEAEGMVEDAKGIVEELKSEIEEWKDNLPENLQGGDKATQLEECVSALEDVEGNLDQVDFGNVEFPSMM